MIYQVLRYPSNKLIIYFKTFNEAINYILHNKQDKLFVEKLDNRHLNMV
jgi:hypothetical protein